MTIVIDSNFFFALKAKNDKNHNRAQEILIELKEKGKDLLITNYLVINETLTLTVARFNGNTHYVEKMYELYWGEEIFAKKILMTPAEYLEIYNLLKKYCSPKLLLSYVDASILYLFQKYNCNYILSFDRHFDKIAVRLY